MKIGKLYNKRTAYRIGSKFMTAVFLTLTRKMHKERFIAYAGYYVVFKSVFNSILMMCLANYIVSKFGLNEWILPILFSIIYYPITIVEIYTVVRKVNIYRGVSYSFLEFFRTWNIGIIVNMLAVWLFIIVDHGSNKALFDVLLKVFIIVFPWIEMYILGMDDRGLITDKYNKLIKDKYGIICNAKMIIFEGKRKKNANAFVKGILWKKCIMISDYMLDSLTEEEVCTILCHELSHCVYYDTEIFVLSINLFSLLLILIGSIFQEVDMEILAGCAILFVLVIISLLFIMCLRRLQEYRADRFSVDTTGDYKAMARALTVLYKLNDTLEERSKIMVMLETHPKLENRIRRMETYYNTKFRY